MLHKALKGQAAKQPRPRRMFTHKSRWSPQNTEGECITQSGQPRIYCKGYDMLQREAFHKGSELQSWESFVGSSVLNNWCCITMHVAGRCMLQSVEDLISASWLATRVPGRSGWPEMIATPNVSNVWSSSMSKCWKHQEDINTKWAFS